MNFNRSAIGAAMMFAKTLLTLAITILLGRQLGSGEFGQYAFVIAITTLIAIPSQAGLPQLVLRETAAAAVSANNSRIIKLWRFAHITAIGASILFSLIAVAVVLAIGTGPVTIQALLWGLAAVPFLALANIRGAALRGLSHVITGLVPETLARPLILLVLVVWLSRSGTLDTAESGLSLYFGAALIAFAVGTVLLFQKTPTAEHLSREPSDHRNWLTSAFLLGSATALFTINANADIVILGVFVDASQVGAYKMAVVASTFVAFGLQAFSPVLMPEVAKNFERQDREAMEHVTNQAAWAILAVSTFVTTLLVLFGDEVLESVIGADFAAGYQALVILCVGQLLGTVFGPVSILLNMTRHEKAIIKVLPISVLMNILMNFLLIPYFGIEGAAFATASSLLLMNAILWRLVIKHVEINPSPLLRSYRNRAAKC